MSAIKPTIGRKVWLWISTGLMPENTVLDSRQAFDASIAFVHPDGRINVTYADHSGETAAHEDLAIHDPKETDQHTGGGEPYCTWMPYQVGQAKAQAIGAAGPVTEGRPS
jgi:hypothetical protein